MSEGIESRRYAARVVSKWLTSQAFPDRMMTGKVPDRGFTMDLVYGTVRWWRWLEYVLAARVREAPQPRMAAYVLLGLQQLLKMDDVPDHAAVHSTLEAAKSDCGRKSVGFLNAILRRVQRERESILAEMAAAPLAVRESHPDALVARWAAAHGVEMAEALCRWNNQPADVYVVLLPGRVAPAAFLEASQDEGIELTPHPLLPEAAFRVPHGVRVTDLPGYSEGVFAVQDPAALGAIELLDIQPGQVILDACAAPGGKAMQIGARLDGTGRLIAIDLHADRMQRLHENLQRAGVDAETRCVDLCELDTAALGGPVDRILLDLPCSNTGVLRRRPDARWRFSVKRLASLVPTQRKMAAHALSLLKPGGKLVYSTCSLEPEENQQQIEWLCEQHAGATVERSVQRLPPRDTVDGAFAAVIRRDGQ